MIQDQSAQNLETGLQPVTTEVGARIGITERASQSDIWESVGAVETPVTKPAGAVVSQRVIVRRVVLQDISIDRGKAMQRLGMQALSAREGVNPPLRVVDVRE